MSKYSEFERVPRDLYETPLTPVIPLKAALGDIPFSYWEPCCGGGKLVGHIASLFPKSTCARATDVVTEVGDVQDVMSITREQVDESGANYFITNPPWINTPSSGYQLFNIINHLASMRPTILLLNANICWNKGSWHSKIDGRLAPMQYCKWVKPTARIKWIEGSAFAGKEDAAWFLFDKSGPTTSLMPTLIYPR
jgi:hypothetical protein